MGRGERLIKMEESWARIMERRAELQKSLEEEREALAKKIACDLLAKKNKSSTD